MAEISKISVAGTEYDIKDETARAMAKAAAESGGGKPKLVASKSGSVSIIHETYEDNGIGDMDVVVIDGSHFYNDVYIESDGVRFTHVRLSLQCWATTLYTTLIELPQTTYNDGYYGTTFRFDGDKYVMMYGLGSSSDHPTGVTLTSDTIAIIKEMYDSCGAVTLCVDFFA